MCLSDCCSGPQFNSTETQKRALMTIYKFLEKSKGTFEGSLYEFFDSPEEVFSDGIKSG